MSKLLSAALVAAAVLMSGSAAMAQSYSPYDAPNAYHPTNSADGQGFWEYQRLWSN